MKYEFKKNGEVLLTLKPEDSLEQAFFKALFSGPVTVSENSSANHNGEVVIRVAKLPTISSKHSTTILSEENRPG